MEKNGSNMTAGEIIADAIARRARNEITEAEYKEIYAVYCAKRKAENTPDALSSRGETR